MTSRDAAQLLNETVELLAQQIAISPALVEVSLLRGEDRIHLSMRGSDGQRDEFSRTFDDLLKGLPDD